MFFVLVKKTPEFLLFLSPFVSHPAPELNYTVIILCFLQQLKVTMIKNKWHNKLSWREILIWGRAFIWPTLFLAADSAIKGMFPAWSESSSLSFSRIHSSRTSVCITQTKLVCLYYHSKLSRLSCEKYAEKCEITGFHTLYLHVLE